MRNLGYRGLIVGLTGSLDTFSVQEFMIKGVNEVLNKPITVEKMNKILLKLKNHHPQDQIDLCSFY